MSYSVFQRHGPQVKTGNCLPNPGGPLWQNTTTHPPLLSTSYFSNVLFPYFYIGIISTTVIIRKLLVVTSCMRSVCAWWKIYIWSILSILVLKRIVLHILQYGLVVTCCFTLSKSCFMVSLKKSTTSLFIYVIRLTFLANYWCGSAWSRKHQTSSTVSIQYYSQDGFW